jgi:hypothetical protein
MRCASSTSTSLTERVREGRGFTEDQLQYDPLLRSMIENVGSSRPPCTRRHSHGWGFAPSI